MLFDSTNTILINSFLINNTPNFSTYFMENEFLDMENISRMNESIKTKNENIEKIKKELDDLRKQNEDLEKKINDIAEELDEAGGLDLSGSLSNGQPNVDEMTYEQLLELEEQMGSVANGLNEEEIKNLKYDKFIRINIQKINVLYANIIL